jgi:hypothetical protein
LSTIRRHWLALSVIFAALAVSVAGWAQAPLVIRVPLVLAFALLGPGAALVPLFGLRDPLGEFTLAVGASLALDVVVACILLYAHAWAPRAGLIILALVALAGAGGQLLVGRERP